MLSMVRNELRQLGFTDEEIDGGGLRVTTTFTQKAMAAAEEGVLAAGARGLRRQELHVAAAPSSPAPGRCCGFYAGQDYLESQLNWAVAGGRPGSTFKPFALATGDQGRLRAQGHLRRQLALRAAGRHRDRATRATATQRLRLGVNLLKATEDSINTAYVDLTTAMADGPEKVIEMANEMGIPPAKPGKTTASRQQPDLEPDSASRSAAHGQPDQHGQRLRTIANGGVRANAVHHREGRRQRRRDRRSTTAGQRPTGHRPGHRRRRHLRACSRSSQAGTGQAALELGRPAAGKTGTATNDDGEVVLVLVHRLHAAAVDRGRCTSAARATSQLDGWLPTFFGGDYPAETWTAIMRRDMEGVEVEEFPQPANVDGEAPDRGPRPADPAAASRPRSRPDREPTTSRPSTPTDEPTDPTSADDGADADPDADDRRPSRRRRPCRRPSPTDADGSSAIATQR